ncbi:MAG: carboxypeptidase-like regulatory domain-containing protein [Bacteroidetes bacterium]|nr:carboxypeptidase-like regulatory domain-containing protein [Bacteroidota bacterium]
MNKFKLWKLQCGIFGQKRISWRFLRSVSLYLLIWGNLTDAAAQQRSILRGSVIDSQAMEPISGALVVLAGTLHGSLTEADGSFNFVAIHHGEYQLTVSAEGYAQFQKSIQIQEDMYLEIPLMPEADEFPDRHTYLRLGDGLGTQLFRGLLPRRVDAVSVEYTLYGASLAPRSYYLDGVRLIDPGISILEIADQQRSQVIPGPYNPSLGMDASVEYHMPEVYTTGAYFLYDSRVRGLNSGLMLHRDWSRVHGTFGGSYSRGGNYSDGSGILQHAGIRSGTIAGRAGVQIAAEHEISGSGGWSQDIDQSGKKFQQRAAIFRYKYTQNAGFLQGIHVSGAFQGLDGKPDISQQSGSVSVRFLPQPNLHLNVGADYYRYTERSDSLRISQWGDDTSSMIETGLYIRALRRITPFWIEGHFRLDPSKSHWGGTSLLTWYINSDWNLILGVGRVVSIERDAVVRQADLGFRWSDFEKSVEFLAFTREVGRNHIHGITADIRRTWWRIALYSTVSDLSSSSTKSRLSSWILFHTEFNGPLGLFKLNSKVYGTLFNLPAWVSAGLWLESREFNGISLRIGIQNLLDGTYTYPQSEFAEPGRSFQFSLGYQSR